MCLGGLPRPRLTCTTPKTGGCGLQILGCRCSSDCGLHNRSRPADLSVLTVCTLRIRWSRGEQRTGRCSSRFEIRSRPKPGTHLSRRAEMGVRTGIAKQESRPPNVKAFSLISAVALPPDWPSVSIHEIPKRFSGWPGSASRLQSVRGT